MLISCSLTSQDKLCLTEVVVFVYIKKTDFIQYGLYFYFALVIQVMPILCYVSWAGLNHKLLGYLSHYYSRVLHQLEFSKCRMNNC